MPTMPTDKLEGPYFLREQGDSLLAPNEIARRIVNMYMLEEQTLRSIWGPTAYVPAKTTSGDAIEGERPSSRTSVVRAGTVPAIDNEIPVYGFRQHGLFHAVMTSGREILLLHTGDELWEWQGWERNWRQLLSSTAGADGIKARLVIRGNPALRRSSRSRAMVSSSYHRADGPTSTMGTTSHRLGFRQGPPLLLA